MADITGMLQAAAGAGGGEETDPNFNQTVLLLHGDGSDGAQNNTFIDSSSNGYTITRNANATQGSFSPFGRTSGNLDNVYDPAINGGSMYCDGANDFVKSDYSAALGTSDFSVEAFIFYESGTDWTGNRVSTSANGGFASRLTSTTVSVGLSSGTAYGQQLITGTLSSLVGRWAHICVCRTSGTTSIFVDGVREATTASSLNWSLNNQWVIGFEYDNVTSADFKGYISGYRLVVGSSAYDATASTLTVPTAPPTDITDTKLLLNFDNAGIFDNTGKNNLETVGGAQIDTTTKKYGTGSMEFDGTGDKLKIPYTPDLVLGTGSFSIEFWIYRNNTTGDMAILDARPSGSTDGWSIFLNSTNKVVFSAAGSNQATGTTTISSGTWYYIAITRSGSTLKIFVDGVEDASVTSSADAKATEGLTIGTKQYTSSGQIDFNGFLDEVRVTKGIARTISLPTKAFPDL